MFEYTKNNHFKFGYNDLNHYQPRENANDRFSFEYGCVEQPQLTWRQSNELAALDIFSKRSGDITILLSGGTDSEICLRSFLDQKLPVKTISLRYLDLNQDSELFYIHKLKADYSLDHTFVDLAVKDFTLSDDFFKIADPIKCVSPIIVSHLWLANQVPGTPIIAQGELHLKKRIPADYIPGKSPYLKSPWSVFESERLCSIYPNFMLRKKPAIPGFFQYLPEQIYSYLTKNPYLTQLVTNSIPGKLGTRTSKNIMSHQFYPEIPIRNKLHGWESEQDFHDHTRALLAQRFPDSDQSAAVEYDEIIQRCVNIK